MLAIKILPQSMIATALLMLTFTSAAQPPTTITTIADANSSPASYVDLGVAGPSIGDQYIFDQPLLDADDQVLGNNAGFCIRTQLDHSMQCQWTLTFANGSLQVAGRELDQGLSSLAIVGGSGEFQGAFGELQSTKNTNGSFTQVVSYWLPSQSSSTVD
jgi:hypothetical protein